MRIAMLGPLEVQADDRTPVEITGVRLRTLLILLALTPGRTVSTDRLIDGVWGTSPPGEAVNALQALVSRLRRALPEPVVESGPVGYRLAVPPDAVDVHRFESLAAAGRAALAGRLNGHGPGLGSGRSTADGVFTGGRAGLGAGGPTDGGRGGSAAGRRAGSEGDEPGGPAEDGWGAAAAGTAVRRAAGILREALGLWRGEPLADVANAAFAVASRARLGELRLGALGDRIEAELAAQDGEHVAELESLVVEHPLHERFAGLLMRALAQAGRPGDALAVYARTRDTLADRLGADPSPELAQLHLSVLRGERATRPERPHTNLRAALTSFVGRDVDLERVTTMVGDSRLVTLTGPGGSGKTRLATEVARGLLERLADVWLVELAPVGDGADLPQAVLTTLGLRAHALLGSGGPTIGEPLDRLAAALSTRPLLLVLDNCEHVIEPAAALVDRLLGECPQLRILATSREPLGINGETLWPVDPLPLPPVDAARDDAMTYPAMRLLADRARSVRPGFTADDPTATAMVHICRALDGMPLAIELAAARLRTMSPDQVATRLHDRFKLLTGGSRMALPRHQTLRAVVDWSWELLDEAERTLLRRLAVFAGGATLEAVEEVCDIDPDQVLDLLSALVDKSLVVLVGDRYRLLETIKAYSLERLTEAGERDRVRRAHVEYFGRLVETAEPHLRRPEQLDWLDRLQTDHDNLTAALRGAVAAGDSGVALWMLANVAWYWWLRGHKTEGGELAGEVLAMKQDGVPDGVRAKAYGLSALIAIDGLRDQEKAEAWFASAVEHAHRVEHLDHPMLRLIMPLEEVFRGYGQPSEGTRFDGLDALTADEDPWVRGTALVMRAHAALNAGRRHAEAETDFQAGLAEYRSVGERWGISFTLCALADLLAWRGELAAAAERYEEAIRLVFALVTNEDSVGFRLRLASLLAQLDRPDESAAMLAEAQRDADRVGLPECLAGVAVARSDFARRRGELDVARVELARGVTLAAHATVAPQFRAIVCTSQGYVATASGRHDEAAAHHAEALDWALRSHDAPVIAEVLVGLADTHLARGDAQHAAELLGASEAIRGVPDLSLVDGVRVAAATHTALGDELFAEHTARGRTTTIDTVLELIPAV